jgi:ubiquinone/menaquinone biosynthesis C-methylase UbiE
MSNYTTDPSYLAYQYGTTDRLLIRREAHERYSERPDEFYAWVLQQMALQTGLLVADIGCGPGSYHPLLHDGGCRVVGVDASLGMLEATQSQAATGAFTVLLTQATAEHLPLAAGSCDRLLCAHMLYHVHDQLMALREMRRVVKPGGRVLIVTNAADNSAVLHLAHVEAARRRGYTPTSPLANTFHLGHLDRVRAVFPNATMRLYQDAFLFPTVEAALRYYGSGMVDAIENLPADGSHRPALLAEMDAQLHAIYDPAGVLRVPKDAGCFVATVE